MPRLIVVLCMALLSAPALGAPDKPDESDDPEAAGEVHPALPAPAPPPRAGVLTADMGDDDSGGEAAQARFEEGLRLLRAGQEAEAAAALLALARDLPQSDAAPEALFEAAQLSEERLGRPAEAQRLYDEVATRYPQSRLRARAEHRRDELAVGLRTGAAPYIEFQDILRTFQDRAQAVRRLRDLLARRPDFALADHARYLLGSALHDAGQEGAAQAALEEALRLSPSGEWAPRAEQLLAQVLLARGEYAAARRHYAALARFSGPQWAAAAAQGAQLVAQQALRRRLDALSLGYLGGLLLWFLWRSSRSPRTLRPPYELWYYLPVAGFLWLVAILNRGMGGPVGRALLQIGLGGVALVWLGGAAGRTVPRGHVALRACGGALLRVLAAAALCYVVIYHGGLLDVLIETVRNGPESTG